MVRLVLSRALGFQVTSCCSSYSCQGLWEVQWSLKADFAIPISSTSQPWLTFSSESHPFILFWAWWLCLKFFDTYFSLRKLLVGAFSFVTNVSMKNNFIPSLFSKFFSHWNLGKEAEMELWMQMHISLLISV